MSKTEFTFDGAIEEQLPFIPRETFKTLKEGTIIRGTIKSVVKYAERDHVTAEIEVNKHITQVQLWNVHTLEEAKKMIGDNIKLTFAGMNKTATGEYPKLYLKY